VVGKLELVLELAGVEQCGAVGLLGLEREVGVTTAGGSADEGQDVFLLGAGRGGVVLGGVVAGLGCAARRG
jgi:hypothetical protein